MPRLPITLRRVRERFVEGNRVALLRNGEQAFPAMLEAIREAKRQVLLEMYWFDSDSVGIRFAEALSEAAERGVEVAVLYDAVGSRHASQKMFEVMRKRGVLVVEFNPVAPWKRRFKLNRLTYRDHRKVLVVDNSIGFTGGINIAEHWLPSDPEVSAWRDDMIRVEGPAVFDFTRCFHEVWQLQSGPKLEIPPRQDTTHSENHSVRVLGQSFLRHRLEITRAYRRRIYRAKERVFITNSYFVPDKNVIRALQRAAQRGVDVKVLLPGVSDIPLIRYASRASWGPLLRSGVKIYEWQEQIMHAKTAVIDGEWSTVGTFNLDQLSVNNNLEINVSIRDRDFGKVMEESCLSDLEHSRRVSFDQFVERPVTDRLVEAGIYRFRKLL